MCYALEQGTTFTQVSPEDILNVNFLFQYILRICIYLQEDIPQIRQWMAWQIIQWHVA